VIARADGKAFTANDPALQAITVDLVETYLHDDVLNARAMKPLPASSAPTPKASTSKKP
jgi:hypothetical protein